MPSTSTAQRKLGFVCSEDLQTDRLGSKHHTITNDGSQSKNTWVSDMDKALLARLNHLESQNEKQKEMIKDLRQENTKLKSESYRKNIAKQELKMSEFGGPWSEAQLDLILNYPLRRGRVRKDHMVEWTTNDIIKGIVLFQKLLPQGKGILFQILSVKKWFYYS